MNRRVVWLEGQRFVRERGQILAFYVAYWVVGVLLSPTMRVGSIVVILAFLIAPWLTWHRSPERSADDAFLLVRGAVTRRGLTATRWLLDLGAIALLAGLILTGDYLIAGSGGFWRGFNLGLIVTGVAFYAAAAVISPRSNRAVKTVGAFIALALLAGGAARAAQLVFGGDFEVSLLVIGILVSALCLAFSLRFPTDFDEPPSTERRDARVARPDSMAQPPRVRTPFTALFLAGMRMLFQVSALSPWLLAGAVLVIAMSTMLAGFDDGARAAQGIFGFITLTIVAGMAPAWLWFGDTAVNTMTERRSPLEFLLSLPIARRRIYIAHELTIAAYLGLAVVVGFALGAAFGVAYGRPPGRSGLAVAVIGFAWSLLQAAFAGRAALSRAAAAGSREPGVRKRMSLAGLLGIAPLVVIGLAGTDDPSVRQAVSFAIEQTLLITLVAAGLVAGVHVATCRRFERLELD